MEQEIHLSQQDHTFARQIMDHPGGEDIAACFHCGTCTAGCPVRSVDSAYNPRNIMRMIALGMKETVLTSDFIWFCSACYSCRERCPQNVNIPEIMTILRNLAVKSGHIHPIFRKQAELLGKFGRLYEVEDFDNKKRVKSGLPQIQKTIPEVKEIFRICGLGEYVAEP